MLTVHGQQHSFSIHERMFLWKCQIFWDKKCLDGHSKWRWLGNIHSIDKTLWKIWTAVTNGPADDVAFAGHLQALGWPGAIQWRYNEHDSVSNHQPHDCLLSRLFRRRSKKTSKLRVSGLCAGNSPLIGEFPAQMASNVENVSIWWRHHGRSCVHTNFGWTETFNTIMNHYRTLNNNEQ